MNKILKAKIIEKYGTQADFAQIMGIKEPFVSNIVRRRKALDPDEQKRWAFVLQSEPEKLFTN